MHNDSHEDGPRSDPGESAPSEPAGDSQGFSTGEKGVGVAAAYTHPLASSVAASAMLHDETDPERRRQLTSLRNGALIWWVVGGIVALIVVLIAVTHAGATGGAGGCKGGPDKFDAMNIVYDSSDGKNWTATYPCVEGGSTTIPIPRNQVPGGGR